MAIKHEHFGHLQRSFLAFFCPVDMVSEHPVGRQAFQLPHLCTVADVSPHCESHNSKGKLFKLKLECYYIKISLFYLSQIQI